MPTTAIELPHPNADIVKLPSMIIPKKLGFVIHQNIKKVGFFSRLPRVAPYYGEKTVWPLHFGAIFLKCANKFFFVK